jgi:hypothetical protein
MQRNASAANHDRLPRDLRDTPRKTQPKSLRERLALLERSAFAGSAFAAAPATAVRRSRVSAYFTLGLVTGGVLGCASLLVLLADPPGVARSRAALPPSTAAGEFMPGPLVATLAPNGIDGVKVAAIPVILPPIDLAVQGSERDSAAFPLRVGGEDAESLVVTLRDMPETAWLTNGERQDEHTWQLRYSDLANLRMSLRDGTPSAFDVKIEVAAATGEQVATTMARVRLLDGQVSQHAIDTPFRTSLTRSAPAPRAQPTIIATAAPAAEPIKEARAPLPQGASALGGPRDGLPEPTPDEGRKMWWKLPSPSWSPFAGEGSTR